MARAPLWAMTDRELLKSVTALLEHPRPDREYLLRELERRLATWPATSHRSLATVLSRLNRRHTDRSRQSQRVDQLLVRLLHQVRGGTTRRLARECLSSSRLLRRRSAWRYFHSNGVGAKDAELLGMASPEADTMYIRLVASSSTTLRTVSVEHVLALSDSFYWRARVLESALAFDTQAVVRAAEDHPVEALLALHRTNRSDQIDLVRDLLLRHPDDVEVISGAIRAFATFRATDDLQAALEIGRGKLSRSNMEWLAEL